MRIYERFIFESFHLDTSARTIELNYSLDDKISFQEILELPTGLGLDDSNPDLENALFALHLAGGASYFKTYCPTTIEIRSGHLDQQQAEFWNKLYTHGLGEFFFQNQIDFHGIVNFRGTVPSNLRKTKAVPSSKPSRSLVPFGGGKDSIVTSELLKVAGIDQTLFRLRGHKIVSELAEIADLSLIEIKRTLSPYLFKVNDEDAFNGHVPITSYISFLTVVVGLLSGYDSVFFSNERSSSYGNVEYLGMQVNHQWSKSLEFEQMLRAYLESFVTSDVQYLNIVRPLSELRIAELFSEHPKYFLSATSCNRNWTLTEQSSDVPRWCGTCPKCAFSFSLLAAFLSHETVEEIFGQNLYENRELLPLYRELWGIEGFKPFECVGTPEEAKAAFYLARDVEGFRDTPIMQEFIKIVLPALNDPTALVKDLLQPDSQIASTIVTDILTKANAI